MFGYTVGKHMLFAMGPVANPSTVETVALFANNRSNDLASAGFLASNDGPCKAGAANVVKRTAGSTPVVVTPALHTDVRLEAVHTARVRPRSRRMGAGDGYRQSVQRQRAARIDVGRVPPRSVRVVAERRAPPERFADAPTDSRHGCTARGRSTPPRDKAAGSVGRYSPCRASTSDRPHVPARTSRFATTGRATTLADRSRPDEALPGLDPDRNARTHARGRDSVSGPEANSTPPYRRRKRWCAASRSRPFPYSEITALSAQCMAAVRRHMPRGDGGRDTPTTERSSRR